MSEEETDFAPLIIWLRSHNQEDAATVEALIAKLQAGAKRIKNLEERLTIADAYAHGIGDRINALTARAEAAEAALQKIRNTRQGA